MGRTWIGVLIFMIGAGGGIVLGARARFPNPYSKICDLVSSKIYLDEPALANWLTTCRARAARVTPFTPPAVIAADARSLLEQLRVSHLEIYDAKETRRLWQGQTGETGISSEFVDGELAVLDVQPGSAAAEAGLRRGDIIVSIQGAHPAPGIASAIGGEFVIQRSQREFRALIEPREMVLDEKPRVILKDDWALMRIPSFRAEFFDHRAWQELAQKLRSARRVVVDLRGNAGGNFVAGLRFLSAFMCAPQEVGYLLKPKAAGVRQGWLGDDLADDHQLEVLDGADVVALRTFDDYGCLAVRAAVLIDGGTASTAELVAQAMRDYLDARVLGSPSAGQLLVGVWYDLPELGPGWKISIPEAVYQTKRGRRIEGEGLRVDRELFYDLAELQAGRDGWVDRAVVELKDEPKKNRSRDDRRGPAGLDSKARVSK